MAIRYWILKSEPDEFSFATLVKEKKTLWTGIRNAMAQKNLREMGKGDLALFFHTGKERSVVGVAKIAGAAQPDPTAEAGESYQAVSIVPVRALAVPVTLAELKASKTLSQISSVKMGRLSVGAVTEAQFDGVLKLGKTTI